MDMSVTQGCAPAQAGGTEHPPVSSGAGLSADEDNVDV